MGGEVGDVDGRWMDVKLVEHSEHSGGVMDLGQVCDS